MIPAAAVSRDRICAHSNVEGTRMRVRWTPVLIDKAMVLREGGVPLAKVAAALSELAGKIITTETVRLALRRARRKATGALSGNEATQRPARAQTQPAPAPEPPRPGEFSIVDLGWRMCRFPTRQIKGAVLSFQFCGADTVADNLMWCPEHAARVFNK
jgi:hypothetical protein